jgi:hypothetical protein
MHRGGPLVGLTVCDQGQSLASSASTSGTVFVLRIEPNSSKMSLLGSRQLDLQVILTINKYILRYEFLRSTLHRFAHLIDLLI